MLDRIVKTKGRSLECAVSYVNSVCSGLCEHQFCQYKTGHNSEVASSLALALRMCLEAVTVSSSMTPTEAVDSESPVVEGVDCEVKHKRIRKHYETGIGELKASSGGGGSDEGREAQKLFFCSIACRPKKRVCPRLLPVYHSMENQYARLRMQMVRDCIPRFAPRPLRHRNQCLWATLGRKRGKAGN